MIFVIRESRTQLVSRYGFGHEVNEFRLIRKRFSEKFEFETGRKILKTDLNPQTVGGLRKLRNEQIYDEETQTRACQICVNSGTD